MKRNEAIRMREIIELAVMSLTDEIALEVVTLFPEWAENIAYEVDMRVKYNGVLYRCLTAHTSQATWTPDVSPGLFTKVLIPDENIIPAWEQPDSANPYMIGDKVTHNDKTWVSIVDNNVWEPGAYGWEEIAI